MAFYLIDIGVYEEYEMIDPDNIARQRRNLMIKLDTREYFIADYWGSEMTKDTPNTERYFRIREYIKSRDPGDYGQKWLDAPISDIKSRSHLINTS